jgi:hypothetical protein
MELSTWKEVRKLIIEILQEFDLIPQQSETIEKQESILEILGPQNYVKKVIT